MKKKLHHWWIPLILVALVLALLTVIFWDTILLIVAPKAVLTGAVRVAVSQLEERFEDDPLRILLNALDAEGKYTADIQLNSEHPSAGSVSYDMSVQTHGQNKQIFAEGLINADDVQLNISCYLDTAFMAISSDELVDGRFYGITYDTFSQDIRSIPLLDFFVSDKKLAQWEASVKDIQEQICQQKPMRPIPEISEEAFHALMIGILAMPCEIEKAAVPCQESVLECQAVTYSVHRNSGAPLMAELPFADDASFEITFYLAERSLVKIKLNITGGNQNTWYEFLLGPNPQENVLSFQEISSIDGQTVAERTISVETHRTEDIYSENWKILLSEQDKQIKNHDIQFDYDLDNGVTSLSLDNQNTVTFTLSEETNGFQIVSDNFSGFIQLMRMGIASPNADSVLSGSVLVTKGSQITIPAYKNIDQWSLEDFWVLLSGVGSLFGISLQ